MFRGRGIAGITMAALLTVAACVGDDPSTGPGAAAEDAGQDANGNRDAAEADATTFGDAEAGPSDAAVPACNRNAAFGAPKLVSGAVNGAANDDGFWLLPDQLTIFTSSARVVAGSVGGFDIFTGTRADLDASFSTLALAVSPSTDGDDRAPTLTDDGKTIYFTRNPSPGGSYDIYVANRTNTAFAFEPAQLAAFPLNDTANDFVSWASPFDPSGSYRVYLSSDRAGSAQFDLYVSVRTSGGFSAPVPIPSLSSPAQDTKVVLTPDELQAFVASARTGTLGGQDIFYASRSDTNQGFSNPTPIAGLNTANDDLPMWVSPDGCTLYFASVRAGGLGGHDVFVATRGN